jgi:O-methyltransferase domain
MPIIRGEWMYRAFADLLYSVRTGQPAFDHVYGVELFEYLAQEPEAAETFNQAMTASGASGGDSAIAAACDLSGVSTVVDIAGGEGSLLAALRTANPGVNGILFELPAVIESARPVLDAAGVADRC